MQVEGEREQSGKGPAGCCFRSTAWWAGHRTSHVPSFPLENGLGRERRVIMGQATPITGHSFFWMPLPGASLRGAQGGRGSCMEGTTDLCRDSSAHNDAAGFRCALLLPGELLST